MQDMTATAIRLRRGEFFTAFMATLSGIFLVRAVLTISSYLEFGCESYHAWR
jgi:hypothetical protein